MNLIVKAVRLALWEAAYYKRPHSIFNHPLFPGQRFTMYYSGE